MKTNILLFQTWDKEAAAMAQEYAGQCRGLQHNSYAGRHTKRWGSSIGILCHELLRFGSCGENIFIATHKVPWHFAIKSWYSEKDLFRYGCSNNNLTQVGVEEADAKTRQHAVASLSKVRGS